MRHIPSDDRTLATRQSLIARLSDWGDARRWQEFFDTYWHLIYRVAIRTGLRDDEAQEVVQETCISVAKNVARYNPAVGSFKTWLLQTARWRIIDQIRRRPTNRADLHPGDSGGTSTLDSIPGEQGLDAVWEQEWREHRMAIALACLKRKVSPEHYQIFDCTVVKGWSASETARALGISIAQIYLIRHRVKSLLKAEFRAL
jgi:RNA polymerase sigma-70 factor (ECF subfamily)